MTSTKKLETRFVFPVGGALTLTNPVTDAAKFRIKAATRDLISACGGLERSATIAGVSASRLSQCQQASEMDSLISLPAMLALQADCGVPYVTAALAALEGRSLSDPAAEAAASNLAGRYSATIAAAGAMLTAMAEAMADGELTPAEADRLDRVNGSFEQAFAGWRQILASVKAGTKAV